MRAHIPECDRFLILTRATMWLPSICIRLAQQFTGWPNLLTKLDIWHFMRRFAMACCSEAHALYGSFMGQLSGCIFEWDPVDLQRLLHAKQEELKATGMYRAAQDDIAMHVTKKELATHCKRRTRGPDESAELIQQLLITYSSDLGKDTMGIPLLNHDRAWQIWEEQKRHLPCVQDPEDVLLYMETGKRRKVLSCQLTCSNKSKMKKL